MRIGSSSLVLATVVFASAALLHAQEPAPAAPQNQQPCATSPQPQPCTTAPAAPAGEGSPTDRFPFPGETPARADSPKTVSPAPSSATQPAAPAESSGKHFPFPGEDNPAAPQAAPSASSSSSSSSADPTAFPADDTDTPDTDAGKDKPAPGGRRLLKRVNPVGTKLLTPDEREAEDLNIARFYLDQGNLQGAYLRTQDAVKTMPDDPDAHCALARAAVKLDKRDEAVTEFNACLKLDPVEKEAKDARRELARLK